MSSPFTVMAELHAREPEACEFGEYVAWHLRNAYVFSTPWVFLMAVPVMKSDLEQGRRPPAMPRGKPDCWYVSSLAGNMESAWDCAPFRLPWIAFDRVKRGRKSLKFYKCANIESKTKSPHMT